MCTQDLTVVAVLESCLSSFKEKALKECLVKDENDFSDRYGFHLGYEDGEFVVTHLLLKPKKKQHVRGYDGSYDTDTYDVYR